MSWFRAKIKVDFFRLLALTIVLIFLGLTIARITGMEVDDQIYTSWTQVTIATLPSSSIAEGAKQFKQGGYNNGEQTRDGETRSRL